jgi:EmrB/QacA subfamily drug resistance transporter
MGSAVNIALPALGSELLLDAVMLGWIATAYLLSSAIFLVPFGRLADIRGRKRVFTFGVTIFAFASFFCGLVSSAAALISFRALQGVGAAMLGSTAVALLITVFPPEERGKVLGINVAATYIGLSLGPILGGMLTHYWGWRSIFFVNMLLGLGIVALTLWKLKGEWMGARGEKFDLVGCLIYSLGLTALVYGFTVLPESWGLWLIAAGIAGLFAFLRWELKAESPILDINLFRGNRAFTFSNLAALINYSATFAISFLLSLYLQYLKGLDPRSAGLILVAMPATQAVFSPPAGRLSDKIEPRLIASAGMALTTVGLIVLVFLKEETSLVFILGNLILIGFGFALFSSPNTNAVMSAAPRKAYGIASATLATMRQVGMVFSMGLVMLMFALYLGRVQITPEYYPLFQQSMKMSFIIFAILCFGGIFASLARGKIR